MNKPFFSIVVPCCNVGAYVDELVKSVRAQSFTDYECILSVERSSDDTLERCEAAANQDSRFRVLFGERSGSASVPRNRGLDSALGQYVVWVDGDDRLADGALARIAAEARVGDMPDVMQFSAERSDEAADGAVVSCSVVSNFPTSAAGSTLSGREAMLDLARRGASYHPMPWLMAIRIGFLRETGIRFIPGIRYEDAEWAPRVFYAARRVRVIDAVCYAYRRRGGSVTTSAFSPNELACVSQVIRSLLLFHATNRFDAALSRAWARIVLSLFFYYFFSPWRTARIVSADWTPCIRNVLRGRGRVDFLRLVRFAGLPKKIAAPFVLLCGLSPALDWPAKAFFRNLYYPLVMRREKGAVDEA